MNNKNIEMLQGQQIEIIDFNLNLGECEATLTLRVLFRNMFKCICFHNVSKVKIDFLSIPFQICGFEIIDNKERGWDKTVRYTVRDFEDEKIQFFCECFDLE